MKTIIQKQVREKVEYFDDFTGKSFGEDGLPVEMRIDCYYGSNRDGITYEFHFSDESFDKILKFIQENLPKGDSVEDHITKDCYGFIIDLSNRMAKEEDET